MRNFKTRQRGMSQDQILLVQRLVDVIETRRLSEERTAVNRQ